MGDTEPDKNNSSDRLDQLRAELHAFVAERNWEQFHDPKNLAMLLTSEAGELAAELRWVPNDAADLYSSQDEHRRRIEAEMADVAIALLLLESRIGIDLLDAIAAKISANRVKYPVDQSRDTASRPPGH